MNRISSLNTPANPDSRQYGQALVEGAFVLLLFFLCVFGVFEAGRMLQTRQVLTNAAREGARASIAPKYNTSDLVGASSAVTSAVNAVLAAANIPQIGSGTVLTLTQNYNVPGDATTQYTLVQVSYAYPIMTTKFFGLTNVSLTGSSLMRNETSP